MYSIRHLFHIGREGMGDMLPAVRQAFNADPTDDRLDEVFGSPPRGRIVGLSLLGIAAGALLEWLFPHMPANEYIHWPAVVVGLIFALLIRRYLFAGEDARDSVREEDFPWLAASLAAPLAMLVAESLLAQVVAEFSTVRSDTAGPRLFIGEIAVAATHALGVAAAMTIAVAALCFSRDWVRGLGHLVVRLVIFRVMVYVTTLVMLDIGFVGPIIGGVLGNIFGIQLPAWLKELVDQFSYAGVMGVIYLAVIGATWTVCRRSFGQLLAEGDVDILKTIEELAEDPKRKQKKLERARKKAEKKALKPAGKRKD